MCKCYTERILVLEICISGFWAFLSVVRFVTVVIAVDVNVVVILCNQVTVVTSVNIISQDVFV